MKGPACHSITVFVSNILPGIAVLLTDDLISMDVPLSVLPSDIKAHTYIDIGFSNSKRSIEEEFQALKSAIASKYKMPSTPKINVTTHKDHHQVEMDIPITTSSVQFYLDDVLYTKSTNGVSFPPFKTIKATCHTLYGPITTDTARASDE